MASERSSDTAYFMFGRFNPPTIGHGSIFAKLAQDATAEGADAFVFVSSTQNSNKNPLSVGQKMYYLEKLFSGLPIQFINTTDCPIGTSVGKCTTPPEAVKRLREMGYVKLVMYAGSDRVKNFQWLRASDIKKGMEFPIEIPADRMPPRNNSNSETGMSATKIREAARRGNVRSVKLGTGLSNENAEKLVMEIRRDSLNVSVGQVRKAIEEMSLSNQPMTKRSTRTTRKKGGKRRTRRH
jgi:nicotinic acid mononucleotide adenylyltransferase